MCHDHKSSLTPIGIEKGHNDLVTFWLNFVAIYLLTCISEKS